MEYLLKKSISVVEDTSFFSMAKSVIEYKDAAGEDESFFLMNVDDLIWKHKNWKQKLPRVKPYYAVKCNDNELVLKLLEMCGTGFDCASKGEIQKIKFMGVDSSRIIYANPTKQNSHIKFAKFCGVERMTFDSEEELCKIKACYPDAKVVLRIRFDSSSVISLLGEKFGCDLNDACRLIEICKDLQLNLVGVSFHVGSYSKDFEVYARAIKAVRDLFDFALTVGFDLNLVDIGGGFCGDDPEILDKYAVYINSALEEYFKDPHYEIIAEPGRYFVSSAFTLFMNVHSKKVKLNENGEISQMHYYVNDGIYQTFLGYFMDGIVKFPKLWDAENPLSPKFSSQIWGNTCDSIDKLVQMDLPELQIGDYLYFPGVGDYSIPISSNFNGFGPKQIVPFITKSSL